MPCLADGGCLFKLFDCLLILGFGFMVGLGLVLVCLYCVRLDVACGCGNCERFAWVIRAVWLFGFAVDGCVLILWF